METVIIEVLSPGCSKCNFLEERARLALEEVRADFPGMKGVVEKITDIDRFLEYGLLTTPGLVINGKLVCAGRVASQQAIADWIRETIGETCEVLGQAEKS